MSDDDPSVVKLATLVHVGAYRRRGAKGQSERVNAYVRRFLDKFGGSVNTKTRVGAHTDVITPADFGAGVARALDKQAVARSQWGAWFNNAFRGGTRQDRKAFLDAVAKKAVTDSKHDWLHPESISGDPLDLLDLPASTKKSLKAQRNIFAGVVEYSAGGAVDRLELKLAATMTHESLDRSPRKNWVENTGQLPAYIQHIARDIHEERGMPLDQAIPIAISRCKVWAAGGGGVKPDTRAKAAAAIAEWEALKAKNKARRVKGAVKEAAS